MGLLRAGRSKLAVLGGIRYSAEGRRLAVKVPGLYRRHLAERVFGLPIIGPVAESLAALVRIRTLVVHHRALEETSFSLAQSVANADVERANVLATRLGETTRALSIQTERSNVVASEVRAELTRQGTAIARHSDGVNQDLRRLDDELRDQRIANEQTSGAVVQQTLRIDAFADRMVAAEEISAELGAEQGAIAKRVDKLAADAGHRWAPLQDSFYAAFEDQFRGTEADIRNRLAFYLPRIKSVDAGIASAPIVDLGCGRGEWLELLRDEGLVARGCDTNGTFVDRCLKAALAVTQQDLFEYLEALHDATVGAVTCFHVVEHLPFPDLIHLLNQLMRVLRPGGIAVIETPNPENLRVGACDFYLDPTHRHPIPPAMLEHVVRSRGFVDTEVVRLHPLPSLIDDENSARVIRDLDYLVQGPRDYAVIFRRSAA